MGAALLPLLVSALCLNATPQAAAPAVVVVRVYNASSAPAVNRHAALEIAAGLLSAASVRVHWRLCEELRRSAPHEVDLCRERHGHELILRLIAPGLPRRLNAKVPLGDAVIDHETRRGVMATVYYDRVAWKAGDAGTDLRTLFGRVIAHELAHLLTASGTHGSAGLMRALWTNTELRSETGRDWQFSPPELAAIRAGAMGRHAEALAYPASDRSRSRYWP